MGLGWGSCGEVKVWMSMCRGGWLSLGLWTKAVQSRRHMSGCPDKYQVLACLSRHGGWCGLWFQDLLYVVRHQPEDMVVSFSWFRKGHHSTCFPSLGNMEWFGGHPLRMHRLQEGWQSLDFLGQSQVDTQFQEKMINSGHFYIQMCLQ